MSRSPGDEEVLLVVVASSVTVEWSKVVVAIEE